MIKELTSSPSRSKVNDEESFHPETDLLFHLKRDHMLHTIIGWMYCSMSLKEFGSLLLIYSNQVFTTKNDPNLCISFLFRRRKIHL